MAGNRPRTSITGCAARRVVCCLVAFALALVSLQAQAQPAGPTYQRRGSGWGGHHDKWRHQPMPSFRSQTSFGSFQRPYPYHLDYYRARWGGSYAPYFGNLYGPPNFFFGPPFFGGFNPFWGFGAYPFSAWGAGVGGFETQGFVGGPFLDGGGYGPMEGFYNPAMAPLAAPMQSGMQFQGGVQGSGEEID